VNVPCLTGQKQYTPCVCFNLHYNRFTIYHRITWNNSSSIKL